MYRDLKATAIILLIAGVCVGAPIAQCVRGDRPDPLILLFILVSHVLAIPIAWQAFGKNQNVASESMLRVMIALSYLAGVGCGVALIVT
ncbi:MAG: hypothetical protein DWH91_04740 [Planctomycetota bacterium]|nr:MAG: hypothetical protein DWH91_04740 [Planctomycetota bacterium]